MARSVRVGIVVLVIWFSCAIAAYAADPSNQTDTPMQNKMQKNEPSMQGPSQQKGRPGDLGSTRGTPANGMTSKPTRKADKGQTDPLEQGRSQFVNQPRQLDGSRTVSLSDGSKR